MSSLLFKVLGLTRAIQAATFIWLKKYFFQKKKRLNDKIDLKRYKSEKCVRNYGINVKEFEIKEQKRPKITNVVATLTSKLHKFS